MSALAGIIKNHIVKNNLSVNISGHNYVLVEGWQFGGGLMGLLPRIVKVEKLEEGKWMAQAEIVNAKTKEVVGTGYALCSKDETKKRGFDEYAILSMAQTRAIGKAYRNLIGWVIKMAGYEATPAEEMKKELVEAKTETKSNATNFLEQLKAETVKRGATSEAEAVKIINAATGLKLKDLKITEKNAQIVLFQLLNK